MRRPFMNHPDQLASLEGQQYLVLRPTGAVADDYREVQDAVLRALPVAVKHPHTAHVTLRGFYEPDRLDDVRALVRAWGAAQHPIEITTEAIDTFPAPWQIVIARLARTASVITAYASLTDALADTDFRRLDERALDDWTFHMSVIYGKTLDADEWRAIAESVTNEYDEHPTEVVNEAELVWYSGGAEHHEVIPLG
ncbi:2'-5' RNA ligase family protein [Microbacterium murale]|uniref:2'-5' RNA ligase n=1 Tax=Microbacterium murale TaxID=1081040 RepID=A0ABU0PAV1_9MICO|nr:2'-5' RNA ligase family protein [Microbacterium murale]MDQ0644465.1 2'-5' RNA ligase [Microbacterium murale]